MGSTAPRNYQSKIVPEFCRIQEKFGYLTREALANFSRETGIPLYRLQAVASFFPHFRLTPPPAMTVSVCRDMACHLAGSSQILTELKAVLGDRATVEGVSCLGRCDRPPAACVSIHARGDEHYYLGRTAGELKSIAQRCFAGDIPKPDGDADRPSPPTGWTIDPYAGPSDYAALRRAIAARDERLQKNSDRRPRESASEDWSDALLAELDDAHADLRGMGGAGIPATQKWRDVRDAVRTARHRRADDRAFIVVNGDESEPGTFKDRELLLRTPHLIIEGLLLAGLITEATEGFIYIRHEYHEQIDACREEIARAERAGICGDDAAIFGRPFRVSVFVSPGGYICGEQSALIEAMSDRRAEPRNLPPKLETNGLDDQPTLVSNVETFAWVPAIFLNGGKAYASMGVNGARGRRFFSVSGDVNRPGVYEVPIGTTLRELIEGPQYCQGMIEGRKLKALAPSGPSGGFLPAKLTAAAGLPRDHVKNRSWIELARRRGINPAATELDLLDLELDLNLFRAISPTQALGGGIVVYAEGRDMVDQAVNAMTFFRNESCGKCVPCRVGSQKMVALGTNLLERKIDAERWNANIAPVIKELGKVMELSSICGLGRSVPVPLRTVIDYFPEDMARYLHKANSE